jgi:hypothetical protein
VCLEPAQVAHVVTRGVNVDRGAGAGRHDSASSPEQADGARARSQAILWWAYELTMASLAVSALTFGIYFIAIGFAGPMETGVLGELGEQLATNIDRRSSTNIVADDRDYRTSVDRLFAAGDVRRGQSLVVWAIREGRQAARAIDEFLMGSTVLPR